jgi:hypothetical protein
MSHEWMARRRVLALGLGGIAGLGAQTLIGGRKAMAQGTPETVVYVSNAGSKEVFVLAINRATGALELIEKTPVPGTDKPSPASLPMATSPDKHFLYAQLRSEPYPVSTFAIDRTTRLKHGEIREIEMAMAVDHFGGVESRVRREKAVEGRAGRVGIALSKLGHGESEHRVGFCLMHPCERTLIEVNGLVMAPETDAFVR